MGGADREGETGVIALRAGLFTPSEMYPLSGGF